MLRWSILFAMIGAGSFVVGGNIEGAPENVTVALNGMATIRCTVNKEVGDEVHWLLGNLLLFVERDIVPGVISDGYRFSVIGTGNDYSLKITQITANDADRYTCKLIRASVIGEKPQERSAYLIVHRPPRMTDPSCRVNNIRRRATRLKYQAGSTVSFQCLSDRGYPDTMLEWSDSNNGFVNTSLDESNHGLFTLYFTRVLAATDNGKSFTCKSIYTSSFVRNQTGSCSTGPIDVQFPAENISISGLNVDSEGVTEFGKSVFLTCSAPGGNPDVMDYTWTVTPPIPPERYQKSMHVFTLMQVEEADQGLVIECAATNYIGDGLRTNITLNVTNLPTTRLPTTVISTSPVTIPKTKVPLIKDLPFSTTYIIIVILIALVILLGTVCCVLFLVNRKRTPKYAVPLRMSESAMSGSDYGRSMSYNRQCTTDTTMTEDDTSCGDLKPGKCSRPSTPCMERRIMDVEAKLQTLQRGQFTSTSNIYGESVQPDIDRYSPEPDDLRKPGRKTPRDSPDSGRGSTSTPGVTPGNTKTHKKLKPTNSTGPDWPVDKPEKYSPLARRHYTPQELQQHPGIPTGYNTIGASPARTRRATQGEVEEYESQARGGPVKGHRRNRSHGSNPNIIEPSIMVESSQHYQHAASPVMQRKHRRQHSGSSLHQLQVMQQAQPQDAPSSRRTSPRPSPRASPRSSSPQHRPNTNRPLPDPGLDSNDDLLIQIDVDSSEPGKPNYSNRTPVMVRKLQRPQELFTPADDYSDSDIEDDDDDHIAEYDEEYDDYVDDDDDDDVCSIHGEGAACDCNTHYK